ncbi:MAG: glycoside hydrolase 100 family protein [bacterium]
MKIEQLAYQKAIEVLEHCVRPGGFYASGLPGGYEAVWARDSMISSLGASLVGDKFKDTIRKSIETLSKNQSELGLIPNCVGSYNTDRRSDVTFNTIDSPLWYLIGHFVYAKRFGGRSLFKKYQKNIEKTFLWLRYQDPDVLGLVVQQPTSDWQDAFPHKYGYTINSLALYYQALLLLKKNKEAQIVKKTTNGEIRKYVSLYDKKLGYYYPWGWKNHDGDREHEEWFDTLGNLLAIITGLATPKIATKILNYIEKEKINRPFPCKCLWPPIKKNDPEWHSYFSKCDARAPYHYLNAGIWPFIGGFYVAALVKMKEYKKAERQLENLARANLKKLRNYEFNEWLDGRNGRPRGEPYQAWSAGTYLWAYECLKRKKVLFF